MASTSLGRLTSDTTSTFEEVHRIRKLLARASDPRLHPFEAVAARTIAYRLISSGLQRGVADFGEFLDLLPSENCSINVAPTPTKRLRGERHEGRVALPDTDHRQLVASRMHYQSGKPEHAHGQRAPKSLFRIFIVCCLLTLMATLLFTLMATFLLSLMTTLSLDRI